MCGKNFYANTKYIIKFGTFLFGNPSHRSVMIVGDLGENEKINLLCLNFNLNFFSQS